MTEIDGEDGAYHVRVGPFRSRAVAERLERFLLAMDAEARVNAGQELPPGNVMAAVIRGQAGLQDAPGHYVIRCDGGPKQPKTSVEFSSGSKYREAETAPVLSGESHE